MQSVVWMVWRGVLVVSLLLVGANTMVLAAGNWWAGTGPPTPNPSYYVHLGNVYFLVALLCLASAITFCVDVYADLKRRGIRLFDSTR